MGRSRSKNNEALPKGVYRLRGRTIYKPYLGRVNGKSHFGDEVVLGPDTMPLSKVYLAYENMQQKADFTLGWLINEYSQSKKFKTLSADWQASLLLYVPKVINYKVRGYGVFGAVPLSLITPATLNRFYEKYSDKIGAVAMVRKLISGAWTWGCSQYDEVPNNPSLEVPALAKQQRDRYVTDEEYACVFYIAPPYWKAMMEFAYICRARRAELINMKREQLLMQGVQLKRAKGSLDEITLWTDRLQSALSLLDDMNEGEKFDFVFGVPNSNPEKGRRMTPGLKMDKNTLDSQWQKIIKRAVSEGLIDEEFHFHDLKAKGVSDHEGLVSGHKTLEAKKVYIRKTQEVKGIK